MLTTVRLNGQNKPFREAIEDDISSGHGYANCATVWPTEFFLSLGPSHEICVLIKHAFLIRMPLLGGPKPLTFFLNFQLQLSVFLEL